MASIRAGVSLVCTGIWCCLTKAASMKHRGAPESSMAYTSSQHPPPSGKRILMGYQERASVLAIKFRRPR